MMTKATSFPSLVDLDEVGRFVHVDIPARKKFRVRYEMARYVAEFASDGDLTLSS
jgi:hypothetical protein